MHKKIVLPLVVLLLTGCKSDLLYKRDAYNSPNFDENYYTTYDDVGFDSLEKKDAINKLPAENDMFYDYGYTNCLSNIYEEFKWGILSKLYDGRTRCDNLYQLSRVQIDKSGFGTKLPHVIEKANSFEFVARGGSSQEEGINLSDFKYTFYVDIVCEEDNKKVVKSYVLNDVSLPTDNNSLTRMISFSVFEKDENNVRYPLQNISYYQIRFECSDERLSENTVDDYTIENKDHLAIMLYEVMLN